MYLIDANVFIQAKNVYYGFSFCPAFWAWLDDAFARNILISLDRVYNELNVGTDALKTWVSKRGSMFSPMDAAATHSLSVVSAWANSGSFTPAAVNTFLSAADYYLVSYAHAHSCTLVTLELPDPLSKKRVKIPDACNALSVQWTSPFKMLAAEQAQFILGP